MGLVRSLQLWDILLIYCNNRFKKYITPFLTVGGGTLCSPSDVYVRSFLCPFSYLNKTLLHKSSWVINLVPGSKAKSSSEITNLKAIKFTISYQMATHFTVIAWRITWTEEEPGGLQSMGGQSQTWQSNQAHSTASVHPTTLSFLSQEGIDGKINLVFFPYGLYI